MVALVGIRHNPVFRAFHERLTTRSASAKLAIVAVVRKLLTLLNAMLRDNAPWQSA